MRAAPTVTAEVCNRGTEPVGAGLPVAVYATAPHDAALHDADDAAHRSRASARRCRARGPAATAAGTVVVDDRGDGTGIDLECREDNNELAITVTCP